MTYLENYKLWLNSTALTEAEKEELRDIADNDDEIKIRFTSGLTFGTAGLRGIIGAGTNRMSIPLYRCGLSPGDIRGCCP